jgi:hypothetical protein
LQIKLILIADIVSLSKREMREGFSKQQVAVAEEKDFLESLMREEEGL